MPTASNATGREARRPHRAPEARLGAYPALLSVGGGLPFEQMLAGHEACARALANDASVISQAWCGSTASESSARCESKPKSRSIAGAVAAKLIDGERKTMRVGEREVRWEEEQREQHERPDQSRLGQEQPAEREQQDRRCRARASGAGCRRSSSGAGAVRGLRSCARRASDARAGARAGSASHRGPSGAGARVRDVACRLVVEDLDVTCEGGAQETSPRSGRARAACSRGTGRRARV